MADTKIILSKKYKETRDTAPEGVRYEMEDLETELRRNKIKPGREEETLQCSTKETLHSYRVNRDWRLITYRRKVGEIILLLVDKHDDSYNRVKRLKLTWPNGNLALPVVEEDEPIVIPIKIKKMPVIKPQPEEPSGEATPTIPDTAQPFATYTQEQLKKLGVPKEQIDRVREVTYEELKKGNLVNFDLDYLLFELAKGELTYEEAVKQVERPSADKVLDKHPDLREHYFVLTDEYRDAFLNGDLENWQVFLHPTQTKAVETDANGPVLVSGPAGTGKSVVAFHRVRWLLRQKGFEGKRILFTTYTKTLAQYAQAMLAKLCTEEELERVDVMTFDTFLRDAWTRGGTRRTGRLGYGQTRDGETWLPEALEAILEEEAYFNGYTKWHGRDREFFRREYLNVIQEYDIRDAEAYRDWERPAIYGKITKRIREQLWPIFEEMNGRLDGLGRYKSQPRVVALNRLTQELTSPGPNADKAYLLGRYGAVVVDEAQDFGASEYRFLAALTGNTIDHPQPTLYLAGDGHQRIYGRIGAFNRCNINVVNRSLKLTVCYRSTGAIREFAEKLLKGAAVKGLDDEVETFGGKSLVQGEPPEERYVSNYTEENDAIASALQTWRGKASKNFGDYAVLLRGNKRKLYAVTKALEERGIPAALVTNEDELDLKDGKVKVMTMHRAKGLQFVGVVLVLDDWPTIPKSIDSSDTDAIEEQMLSERQLLYMAAMRAQRFLLLTSSNGHSAEN